MKKYENIRNQRMERIGHDKLLKSFKKKIETTMIGSLSSFEKYFGEFFDQNQEIHDLYQQARSEILDKGNYQLRNTEAELSNYIVTEKLNEYTFRFDNQTED